MESDPIVLVTGATGYIGSHTCVELINEGFGVVGVDNFDNSSPRVRARIEELAGPFAFEMVDLRDEAALADVFARHRPEAVIHFAGLKAVGQSVAEPLLYFDTNVKGSIALLGAMQGANVKRLVFSSSCTVYGNPDPRDVPLTEASPVEATNPYGRTKLFIERMLGDLAAADESCHFMSLRYFNPVGAHSSGRLGEDPSDVPTNLMPYIMQVAVGRREALVVHGGDYPTVDGTCVRDYIHVVDLARGHVAALENLRPGHEPLNLGTGVGSSVLEVLGAAERATGNPIAHRIGPRRPGDATMVYADPARSKDRLGWVASRTLDEMCADHWRWQSLNPDGYGTER